ncbi:hypothetical protein KCU85_g262, partial [Aureobasidium melanogenum]
MSRQHEQLEGFVSLLDHIMHPRSDQDSCSRGKSASENELIIKALAIHGLVKTIVDLFTRKTRVSDILLLLTSPGIVTMFWAFSFQTFSSSVTRCFYKL